MYHRFEKEDRAPIRVKMRRIHRKHISVIKSEVEQLMKDVRLFRQTSPFASQTIIVKERLIDATLDLLPEGQLRVEKMYIYSHALRKYLTL